MSLVNAISSSDGSVMDMFAAGKGNDHKEIVRQTFSQLVKDKKVECFTRIQSGSSEQSFQIGSGSYTETEWKKLLKGFDAAEAKLRESAEGTKKEVQEAFEIFFRHSKEDENILKQEKILGIGFLDAPTGNISYGMRAEYAEDSTSVSPVIKVTIQTDHSEETYFVDINQVDARNATEIEMFALCCYADDTGKGTGGEFGTWQTLNYYRTNASDNRNFNLTKSMESCLTIRQNWLLMIEQMKELYHESGLYEQSLDGSLLLKCLTL